MKIKLMRFLDYWAGLPLCFLLNCLHGPFGMNIFRKKENRQVKKVLFIKLSELGAIILAYPLLKGLKHKFPGVEIFFATFEKNREVFALLDGIVPEGNVVLIRQGSLSGFAWDTLCAIKRLRRQKIDIIFDLDFFSRFTAILSLFIEADKRAGFYPYMFEGLYRGNWLTHKTQYNPLKHITHNYLSLLEGIDRQRKDKPESQGDIDRGLIAFPVYRSAGPIRKQALLKLRQKGIDGSLNIFLINPGEGVLTLREWPLENFIQTAKAVLTQKKHCVVIIGTEGANQKARLIVDAVGDKRCVDMTGETSLQELMELFSLASALVSNDCGLAHLAMLTGVKKFILFGPESPRVFGPLGENNYILYSDWPCSPCLSVLNNRDSACADNKCLQGIPARQVADLLRDCVGEPSAAKSAFELIS